MYLEIFQNLFLVQFVIFASTISICSRRLNVRSSVPNDAGIHDEVAREEVAEHGTYVKYVWDS